jgi:alanine racemase
MIKKLIDEESKISYSEAFLTETEERLAIFMIGVL